MARRILILGIPAIAAYGIYTTNRLLAEYPIRAVSTYHQSPEIIPTLRQAKDFGRVEVIYARVPLKADCTSVGQKETEPLDRLLKAFWSTWTVRLEAFLAPILISPSPPAELVGTDRRAQPHQEQLAFARSLFPIYRYYPTSVVFQWRFTPAVGGIQELAAVEKQDEGVLEISYACAQYGISDTGPAAGWGDRVMGAFHRMYMRFLLNQARWKMERDAC